MLKVAYFGYRKWAFEILDRILAGINPEQIQVAFIGTVRYAEEHIDYSKYQHLTVIDPKDGAAIAQELHSRGIAVALFYGWSWMVPTEAAKPIDCLCLHPSLLPRYRGGSPFQNQIIAGEQSGGLTIFRMNEVLDGGEILGQQPFPLTGTLADILDRVVEHGARTTLDILSKYATGSVIYQPQANLDNFPPLKRRTPDQSEIQYEKLKLMKAEDLYNLVRALDDPYPNCFIRLARGRRFCVKFGEKVDTISMGDVLFDGTEATARNGVLIACLDGYLRVVRSAVTD